MSGTPCRWSLVSAQSRKLQPGPFLGPSDGLSAEAVLGGLEGADRAPSDKVQGESVCVWGGELCPLRPREVMPAQIQRRAPVLLLKR